MITRHDIEGWYKRLHEQFSSHATYKKFIGKTGSKPEAEAFVKRVCKAHLRSPQVLGFVYAVTSPKSRHHIEHNLLEELGHESPGDPSHPLLLKQLAKAMGVSDHTWTTYEDEAEQVLRNKTIEPIMFGTLMETGLNVMLEVFAFEWMLARESRHMGTALKHYLGLEEKDLEWFYHHSEVDIAHAEQGLDTLVDYLTYFKIDDETVRTVAEITFRENVFLKRYFDLQVEFML